MEKHFQKIHTFYNSAQSTSNAFSSTFHLSNLFLCSVLKYSVNVFLPEYSATALHPQSKIYYGSENYFFQTVPYRAIQKYLRDSSCEKIQAKENTQVDESQHS